MKASPWTRGGLFSFSILLAAAGCGTSLPVAPHPIHWEQYSDDVFSRAAQQKKLVIMDLEAVWCHWCHVQDEMTYTDPKVVELINAKFIAIKVDQDSRPDLSNRYEDYGWPATILFNGKGTELAKLQGYIEPRRMEKVLQAFVDDPTPGPSAPKEAIVTFGSGSALSADLRLELQRTLAIGYDPKEGGWGTVHKFLDWDAAEYSMTRARAGDKEAEKQVRQSLDASLKLIDPVWGGVYQYSTDADWVHPHFEKLMQFQAELLRTYSMADAQFHEPKYRKAADAIRSYIGKFLTSPEGAFYVSQDADVVQGEHSAGYFALDDAGRRKIGIPRVDTHCYSRENGWAIRGLLAYYALTQNPADLDAAKRAAEWVIANRSLDDGGFSHDGIDTAGPFLADTLAMGRAFLALYEATADRKWLGYAQAAANFIVSKFWLAANAEKDAAGFGSSAVSPLAGLKPRPQIDENVAAARFLNLLHYYTGRKYDRMAAMHAMRYLAAPQIVRSRRLFVAGWLIVDMELSSEPLHVTIVGRKDDPAAAALFKEALKSPSGYRRLEWYDITEGGLPNHDVQYPTLPAAAAFLCAGTTCSSPITDPRRLAEKLGHMR